MAILFVQVVALATQVKRPENGKGTAASGGTRLIRVWTVTAISPFERAVVGTGSFIRRNFHNYIDLHNVRKENRQLQDEIAQLKLEQVRLRQDAEQARRLQGLLGFTQHYVGKVVPAQVIGTSGSEQSHIIQIDKGFKSGIKVDMPVITPDGIVGKVKDVYPYTSQVLMISDRDSGAGVLLQNSRLQGILRGSPQGELHVSDIMSDEKIDVGEEVVTSGGDRIYPKGLPVGTVTHVSPDHDNDPFLAVRVKPAADLNRLEEVLVVTSVVEETPEAGATSNLRAADILSERLPSIPKPDETKKAGANNGAATSAPPAPPAAATNKPAGTAIEPRKVPPAAVKNGETVTKKTAGASTGTIPGARPSPSPAGSAQPGALKPAKPAGAASEQKKGTSTTGGAKPPAKPSPSPSQATGQASPAKTPATANRTSAQHSAAPGQKNTAAPTATPVGNVPGSAPKPKPAASPVKKLKPQASPSPSATPNQANPAAQSPANPETPPR